MKKYSSYKDSGIEWIGKIPNHWEEVKLRRVGILYGGLTGKSGNDFRSENNPKNKPYIPYTNIFNNTYISREHFDYVVIEKGESQNRVKKFDLFFLMSSETYEDLGTSSILIEDVDELYLNSFCKGFRINKDYVYPLYLNYLLLGNIHKKLISIEGEGFTRINLRQSRLKNIPIIIPSFPEQKQIVEYLDKKTSKIDRLIQSKQRKIDLLKEKRISLINEVVTKGLNPNVEMKRSGVEWVGKIPVHWNQSKIKYLFKFKGGGTPSKGKSEYWDGSIPWVSPKDMKVKFIKSTKDYITDLGLQESSTSLVKKNSLLIVVRSGILRKTIPVSINKVPVSINQDLKSLTPINEILISYFYYFIKGNEKNLLLDWSKEGTTVESLETDFITDFEIPYPSILEQQEIVKYLDTETQTIDNTIELEKKKINFLKEYKDSLISEVVTGKINVQQEVLV